MRKSIIAGNWKMNMTQSESVQFIKEFIESNINSKGEVVVCIPFTSLSMVGEELSETNIKLGAQNVYFEDKGAYTGEISADMLLDLGVEYVIVGHSERREIFKESNEDINKKVLKLLEKNIRPILCVGETLEERDKNEQFNVVKSQLVKCLEGVTDIEKVVIAYEPIWAIGTGKSASSNDAEEMCKFIRSELNKIYASKAECVQIQYGGSVKPSTIDELMSKENIDGALVGGASLIPTDFARIVSYEVVNAH